MVVIQAKLTIRNSKILALLSPGGVVKEGCGAFLRKRPRAPKRVAGTQTETSVSLTLADASYGDRKSAFLTTVKRLNEYPLGVGRLAFVGRPAPRPTLRTDVVSTLVRWIKQRCRGAMRR